MAYIVKKVEYTLKNNGRNETWTAYIAGRNTDEVLKYLRSVVRQDVNVTQISDSGRLDAVTDELRQIIAKPIVAREVEKAKNEAKKPGPGRPKKKQ